MANSLAQWLADHPDSGELSSYSPTARERQTDTFRNMLFSDDREGQGKSERLMNVLDMTGANLPASAYDVGQAAGKGDLASLAITVGAGAIPMLGRSLRSTPAREFLRDASGMFMGPKAKTANLKYLQAAQNMEKDGWGREEIFDNTGWFKGKDEKWRFEIPSDNIAQAVMPSNSVTPLNKFYSHPGLYEAYPELRNIAVKSEGNMAGFSGSYDPHNKQISMNARKGNEAGPDVISHEVQHAIQDIEGFDGGANTRPDMSFVRGTAANQLFRQKMDNFKKKMRRIPTSAEVNSLARQSASEGYDRSSGEVEARNTARRIWSGYEKPPWETADLPEDQQMIEQPAESVLDNLLGKFGVSGPGFGKKQSMMAEPTKADIVADASLSPQQKSNRLYKLEHQEFQQIFGKDYDEFKQHADLGIDTPELSDLIEKYEPTNPGLWQKIYGDGGPTSSDYWKEQAIKQRAAKRKWRSP